jgi:hypothetical protein
MQIGQRAGQIVDRAEQEVLGRPGRCLDGGRREGRLAPGREDDPVDAGSLGASKQRPDILRILERIEDEDEGWLPPLLGAAEDVGDVGEVAGFDHERHTLVAVEPGDGRQRPTFDLHDRDAQAGGMEDELLQGAPSLGDDQETVRDPTRCEGLLDRASTGHQLLVAAEEFG